MVKQEFIKYMSDHAGSTSTVLKGYSILHAECYFMFYAELYINTYHFVCQLAIECSEVANQS